ncbi:aggrecan core protein-like [Antedon mediterranea]|uniref:aggrecan core protein-like n=1 Tax=Antedon mediterranea TaxID=105859 RepID=UPI003AF945DB
MIHRVIGQITCVASETRFTTQNRYDFLPGESITTEEEKCVYFIPFIDRWWNIFPCSERINYICEKFHDTVKPTYGSTCPEDFQVIIPLNETSAEVTWTPPTWEDNECVVSVDASHSPGYVIHMLEEERSTSVNITYTAHDRAGNPSAACSFTAKVSYCPEGMIPNIRFSSCYGKSTSSVTYQEGGTFCQDVYGGYLAIISCQEENDWILNNIVSLENAWIGYDDIQTEGTFLWSAGNITDEESTFENWHINKPDHGTDQHCTVIIWKSGKWNNTNCKLKAIAICEKHYSQPISVCSSADITTGKM